MHSEHFSFLEGSAVNIGFVSTSFYFMLNGKAFVNPIYRFLHCIKDRQR